MMNLAKLLHHRGFHITFVNSEYNHKRLLKSRKPLPPSTSPRTSVSKPSPMVCPLRTLTLRKTSRLFVTPQARLA
ncbi:hypothetical protein GBA52_026684 [Prunus armeniaca]|nr:hypothetical protein GBA52_026684 [Prunus armeniaca]